jgi:hypothetical protein
VTAALEVDAVAFVIGVLTDAGVAQRVATDVPADLTAGLPMVRVLRMGGPDDGVIVDEPTMVLHAFAASDQAANTVLYQAGSALRAARGVVRGGAVLVWCRKLGGPFWAGYDNPAVRHAVSNYQLRIKINP